MDLDVRPGEIFGVDPYFSAADIISTVEFDHTGNYLATGDKGGRVVLFERNETVCPLSVLWPCCYAS